MKFEFLFFLFNYFLLIKNSDFTEFEKKKLTNAPGAMMNIAKALIGSGFFYYLFLISSS
jgi:hypothetical protein